MRRINKLEVFDIWVTLNANNKNELLTDALWFKQKYALYGMSFMELSSRARHDMAEKDSKTDAIYKRIDMIRFQFVCATFVVYL